MPGLELAISAIHAVAFAIPTITTMALALPAEISQYQLESPASAYQEHGVETVPLTIAPTSALTILGYCPAPHNRDDGANPATRACPSGCIDCIERRQELLFAVAGKTSSHCLPSEPAAVATGSERRFINAAS